MPFITSDPDYAHRIIRYRGKPPGDITPDCVLSFVKDGIRLYGAFFPQDRHQADEIFTSEDTYVLWADSSFWDRHPDTRERSRKIRELIESL